MAKVDVLESDGVYLNTDRNLVIEVLTSAGVPRDVTGFAMSWMVKKRRSDPDVDAILTKTTPTDVFVTGTYSATVASNTQRVVVQIAASDTGAASPEIKPTVYFHELKRTDAGLEEVLLPGKVAPAAVFTFLRALHQT